MKLLVVSCECCVGLLEISMKKIIFAILVFVLPLSVFAAWECESEADCSKGMKCNNNLCVVDQSKFSTYAVVTITEGENSPNDLGSNKIFVTYPATDQILGQLAVEAVQGDADGKYFLIKEINLNTTIYSSTSKVTASDIKLVYDENGNGVVDSGEEVVAVDESEQTNMPKLVFDQTKASYGMNKVENFLVLGSFTAEGELDPNIQFGVIFKPFEGSGDKKEPQVIISNAGDVALTSIPENIAFPKFTFELESGYFLLSSGKYFPEAPLWPEMNGVHTIMHLRVKALGSDNELKALNIKLEGSAVSYGNGVKRLAIYSDDNNDGKGDTKLVETVFETESETIANQALMTFPSGTFALKKGEEAFLVVEAELEFYSSQVTTFYISNGDVQLLNSETVLGINIATEEFRYNCNETDERCRLKPGENPEQEEEDGCSILFIR